MSRTRTAVIIFILTNICLVFPAVSPAYIICPELILENMIATLGRSSGYVVSQQVSLDDSPCDALAGHAAVFEETAWFKPSGKFRSEIIINNVKREYVSADDQAVTIIDRQIISIDENPLMLYKDPFVFRGRERLAERLATLGIDMTVVSLGRFRDTVAFVIGAQYPDESVSQFWVDKKAFLPLRLLLKGNTEKSTVEIRYLDWKREPGFQHPMRVEIYQNDRIRRVICVRNIQSRGSETDGFFDVTALRTKYPTISAEKEKDANLKEEKGDIQETIDNFRKLYQ